MRARATECACYFGWDIGRREAPKSSGTEEVWKSPLWVSCSQEQAEIVLGNLSLGRTASEPLQKNMPLGDGTAARRCQGQSRNRPQTQISMKSRLLAPPAVNFHGETRSRAGAQGRTRDGLSIPLRVSCSARIPATSYPIGQGEDLTLEMPPATVRGATIVRPRTSSTGENRR